MQDKSKDLEIARGFDDVLVELPVTFRLSEGTFHSLMISAIEGGSGYWARIDVGRHEPGWRNYLTARFTEDDGETHQVSLDRLKAGLALMANKYPHHFKDVMMDDADAKTGDVLVQLALFGELKYD